MIKVAIKEDSKKTENDLGNGNKNDTEFSIKTSLEAFDVVIVALVLGISGFSGHRKV